MHLHRDTPSNTQLSMTNIHRIIQASEQYGIDRETLLNIVHSYIKNLNKEIYLIRLTQLCSKQTVSVCYLIKETVETCVHRYHQFPHVLHSGFVYNRFIVFYCEREE